MRSLSLPTHFFLHRRRRRRLQVNAVTHMGQPALLYLCPLTLGAVVLVAATRRDLAKIWSFTDTSASSPGAKKQQQQREEEEQQEQQQQQEGPGK